MCKSTTRPSFMFPNAVSILLCTLQTKNLYWSWQIQRERETATSRLMQIIGSKSIHKIAKNLFQSLFSHNDDMNNVLLLSMQELYLLVGSYDPKSNHLYLNTAGICLRKN